MLAAALIPPESLTTDSGALRGAGASSTERSAWSGLRNPWLLRGPMPEILKGDSEAVKVCLEAAVNVPLHLDQYLVKGTWLSSAADSAAEWAVETGIGSLEKIVDLPQCDGRRMPSENEATGWAAETLHQPRVRESGEYLCDEWHLQVTGLGNLSRIEARLAIVVHLCQSAQHRNRALGLFTVHA